MNRQFPSDDYIRGLLRERIEASRRAVGGVIGIVNDSGRRTLVHGRLAANEAAEVASDSLFELGCVTKVLTGVLCADMLERGEIHLADRVADYLPADVPTVGRNGVAITIEHLLTHTAGLPHHEMDVYDPIEAVFDVLREHVPRQDVGPYYEYSTAGYSILGYVLERRTGVPHATLVRERVCAPLQMTDTTVDVPPEAAGRLARGHDAGLRPIGPFGTPTVTGGYGFHSTADDLLRLLAACTGHVSTPLDRAIARTTAVRRRGAPGFEDVGLAWHISALDGRDTVSHDGNSLGHRAFVGYSPQDRLGVVALLNSTAPVGVTDHCRHLLNPAHPVMPSDALFLRAPREPGRRAELSPESLDRYAGVYQMTPKCRLIVERRDDGLWITDGRNTRQLVPLNETEFWLPASGFRPDGIVRFEVNGSGPAVAMTAPDKGFRRTLVRVAESSPPVWHGRSASGGTVPRLQQYAGFYQFGEFVLEVTCADGTLWGGWISSGFPSVTKSVTTGGSARPVELLHERDHRFFFKSDRFDAGLVFEPGADARIVAVTCQMGEKSERGPRMPSVVV